MSDKPGSSKRFSSMPDSAMKRPKSKDDVELEDSEDEIYAESDADNTGYYFGDSEISSESDEETERNKDVVSKQISIPCDPLAFRTDSPSSSAAAPNGSPTHAASTTPWSSDFSSMREIPFIRKNELLVSAANDPSEYFNIFLNEDYLQKIADCTNKYADNLKNSSHKVRSRICHWKPLTVEELKIFIGLLLHTGTAKMNRLVDYWKVHRLYKSAFPQYMSRNRFQLILRCLYFDDEDDKADRMNKCKLVIDNFNNIMEFIYYPDKNLSLEESMILWRGRLIFRQFMKEQKPKQGIKLYKLAEPNGTILKVNLFASSSDDVTKKEHIEEIVETLLDGKLHAGHAVFMDGFYNSYDLAVKLLEQNTYCTGILNKKGKEIPRNIITEKLEKGENKSLCRSGVHIGRWKDKREINYITTEFPDEMQEVGTRRGSVTQKPAAIINYNKNMSGLDIQDQMLNYYPCESIALRWYVKIFVHTLMMSLINARILYNKYSNNRNITLYDFREKIIESYLPEINQPQTPKKKHGDSDQHKLTKIEKAKPRCLSSGKTVNATSRKDCRNCYKNKKRVNTTTECKICPGTPPLCIDCFFELHDCTSK